MNFVRIHINDKIHPFILRTQIYHHYSVYILWKFWNTVHFNKFSNEFIFQKCYSSHLFFFSLFFFPSSLSFDPIFLSLSLFLSLFYLENLPFGLVYYFKNTNAHIHTLNLGHLQWFYFGWKKFMWSNATKWCDWFGVRVCINIYMSSWCGRRSSVKWFASE